MSKQLQTLALMAGALAGIALTTYSEPASAAIISSTYSDPVDILGKSYQVTFLQSDTGLTSFNEVFGSSSTPTFTFTTVNDAFTAAQAIINAIPRSVWEPSPFLGDPNGFQVIYSADATDYSYFTGFNSPSPNGPFDTSRTAGNRFSIATFAEVPATPIPTPALLPGLIGLGAAAIRKRKSEQKETVAV